MAGSLSTSARLARQAEKLVSGKKKAANLAACGSCPPGNWLGDGDFARFHFLRFRQSEYDDALIHLRHDFSCVDGRIEFKGATIIFRPRFSMNRCAFD